MKRNLELTLEQAQKLYKEQPEMRELLLTTFSKEELEEIVLRDWEEVIRNYKQSFYSVHERENIHSCTVDLSLFDIIEYSSIIPSKKHAESILAFCKLSMLMNDLGDECKVDWSNAEPKYCILTHMNKLDIVYFYYNGMCLAFKTKKVAQAFLEKHRDLIKDYFML